jgi:hypothetical protein
MTSRNCIAALCGTLLILASALAAGEGMEGPRGEGPHQHVQGADGHQHAEGEGPHEHGRGRGRAPRFPEIDTDGDGRVSLEEFKAFGAQRRPGQRRFKALDADGDGAISAKEAAETPMGRVFERADANNDGVVTREEAVMARPDPATVFARADANDDGYLSQQEMRKLHGRARRHRVRRRRHQPAE